MISWIIGLLGLQTAAHARNYLVIMVDDLGVDKVAAYEGDYTLDPGDHVAQMDTVAALSEAGIRFTRGWSNPVCVPTRASVQSGLHPLRHGLGTGIEITEPGLDPNSADMLAQLFAADGFDTGYFGKWQISNEDSAGNVGLPLGSPYFDAPAPALFGYATFDGILGGLGAGDNTYTEWDRQQWYDDDGLGNLFNETEHVTYALTEAAAAWIAERSAPWIAFLAYPAPHGVQNAFGKTSWSYADADPACFRSADLVCLATESCADEDRSVYQALAECVDVEIETLLDGLEDFVLDDTTIVFVSDNGTPVNVLDGDYSIPKRGKGTTYESGVRVPFVIADGATYRTGAAGVISSPGRTSTATVHTTDLYATLLDDATGTFASPDSRSMLGCLTATSADCGWGDQIGYTEKFEFSGNALVGATAAVRSEQWKLRIAYNKASNCLKQTFVDTDAEPLEQKLLKVTRPEATPLRDAFTALHADAGGWAENIVFCP